MLIASVNNSSVNQQYQLIKLAWRQYQCAPETLDSACLATLKQQALHAQKIMMAVLASNEAKGQKVLAQEIDFMLEQLEQQFDSIESFNLSLQQQALSKTELEQAIYQDLLCEKIIAAQGLDYPAVTRQEAVDYYHKNKEKFVQGERRKVSHILITINDKYPENKREKAMQRIKHIRAQLNSKKETFIRLAQRHSECPTALNNGLIGDVSRGQLYAELDKILFNMQAKMTSNIIETEIGYHILHCHDITLASETSAEDALKEISKQLNLHRKKKGEKKWLNRLLTTA